MKEPAASISGTRTLAEPIKRSEWIVLGVVLLLTVIVYGQTVWFQFCNFDDDAHVYENRHVSAGLSAENLRWAFGIHGPSQWHPLAWISHQLDSELFGARPKGPDAGGHHAVNLLFHLANVILVYATFRALLGRGGPSLFIAAIFAVHPLNVESVAWVSERRNVLCLFFALGTILAYARFVTHGGSVNYLLVCVLHTLALMAKPMAVTIPCVLLLLDFLLWQRTNLEATDTHGNTSQKSFAGLLWEKLPLLLLSLGSCLLTIWCQQAAGVVSSFKSMPLDLRLANAFAAYASYMRTFVWPFGLSVFYPHPAMMSGDPWNKLWLPACAGAILIMVITIALLLRRQQSPLAILGWFWFLGTMVPMIGIMQVGLQQRADRYMYLPMLGLLMALSSVIPSTCWQRVSHRRTWAAVTTTVVLLLAARAFDQTSTWQNSLTLFEQSLSVDQQNHWAHLNAGLARQDQGQWDQAAQHFTAALAINPNYALAHYNLGVLLYERGNVPLALERFQDAVRFDPALADAWVRLGAIQGSRGQFDLAEHAFRTAITIDREHIDALFNLGLILEQREKFDDARQAYQMVLKLNPQFEPAKHRLRSMSQVPPNLQDGRTSG